MEVENHSKTEVLLPGASKFQREWNSCLPFWRRGTPLFGFAKIYKETNSRGSKGTHVLKEGQFGGGGEGNPPMKPQRTSKNLCLTAKSCITNKQAQHCQKSERQQDSANWDLATVQVVIHGSRTNTAIGRLKRKKARVSITRANLTENHQLDRNWIPRELRLEKQFEKHGKI